MNERIRGLIQAADRKCSETRGVYDEILAELIVRECAQVCADRGKHHDGLYSAWASDCSERIEQHFGVE